MKQAGIAETNATEARKQQALAETNAAAAEKASKQSRLIAEFMGETLLGVRPNVAKGRDITMLKEMMDAAAVRIEKGNLASVPEAEIDLRATIGNTYASLAVFDAAEKMLEPAVALARSTYAGDHGVTASVLNNLALMLQERGELARAEPICREALAMKIRLFAGDHLDVAIGLHNLALLLQTRGDLTGAEPLCRETLEMKKRLFTGDHCIVATSLNLLAGLLQLRGDPTGAEALYRESLEMAKRLFPGDHPDVLTSLNSLAVLYWMQGKLDLSVPLFQEILKIRETKLGRQHKDTLSTIGNLGVNYRDAGHIGEAIPLLEEAYQASKRLPSLSFVGGQLLDAYTRATDPVNQQSIARVTTLMHELLADARATLPKSSPQLAGQLALFSMTLLTLKAWDEAEPLLREALTIREAKEPDEWRTFVTRSMLGGAMLGQKKYADSEPLLLATAE